jgi:aminopeptidase N
MTQCSSETVFLADYAVPPFLVDYVNLNFDLSASHAMVKTFMALRRNPASQNQNAPLFLHGVDLALQTLKMDGEALPQHAFRVDTKGLSILHTPDAFLLEVTVRIHPQENTALEGLYRSGGMFCTQCEAEGFRRITFFPDRPDVMTMFTTTIVADKKLYPVLLSNGNLVKSEDLDDGLHQAVWHDPFPKPSYLFALVAGDIVCEEDSFITCSGRQVALRIYLEKHNIGRGRHALEALKKAMRWDEDTFGLEYDLDLYMIVAVDDFNMGAMENKGLNIFNSKYVLADPDTATDADFQAIEEVVAHEYFHNWTGNRVTCRDWFQLSLKEGLTVFRDQEFSADQVSKSLKRIHDVRLLRTVQFAEDSGPLAHPVRPESYQEINNFYTATVYEKGAEVIRMMRNLVGTEGFRNALALYFKRFDGKAVTIEDFIGAVEDAAQIDLSQFRLWYSQSGTPHIRATGNYDSNKQVYSLTLCQDCPDTPGQSKKEPFHIPVSIALLDSSGREIPLYLSGTDGVNPQTTTVLSFRKAEQTFQFDKVPCAPVISLLKNFSAPVKLVYDCPDTELMFLMVNDSDPFNRWDAAQQLSSRVIMRGVDNFREGGAFQLEPLLLEAFREVLRSSSADRGLAAQMLMLPTENYLMDQRARVDVDGIVAVRKKVYEALSEHLHEEWQEIWHDCVHENTGPYGISPQEVSCRALKNVCLGYLAAKPVNGFWQQSIRLLDEADNMTDRLALLGLLADSQSVEGPLALDKFFMQARSVPLVLDKWFAVQSTSRHPLVLEKVHHLLKHECFNLRNPNRVRSVLHSFARGNPYGFHRIDGAGYRLIADYVVKIDGINPQVAATLAVAFSSWRRFDDHRALMMRQRLEEIASLGGLSNDLREIVERCLHGNSK